MGKIKSLFKKVFNTSTGKIVGIALIGYLFSLILTPQQAGKGIKTVLTTGCNAVFQNHLCSAVGLKKNTVLAEVYPQAKTQTVVSKVVPKKLVPMNKPKVRAKRWSDAKPLTVGIFGGGYEGSVAERAPKKPKTKISVEDR